MRLVELQDEIAGSLEEGDQTEAVVRDRGGELDALSVPGVDHRRDDEGALAAYRYLGISAARGREEIAVRHDMRNETGGIMAAPLCIISPESGGFSDEDSVPNPIIASENARIF